MANGSLQSLRWTLTLALAFVAFAFGSFGYLFFSATQAESRRIDAATLQELALISRLAPWAVVPHVRALLAKDEHRVQFAAVFDARGRLIAGNIARLPDGLGKDGRIRELTGLRVDDRGRKVDSMRVAARRLAGGWTVAIGHDLDARDRAREDLGVATVAGLLPALGVAISLGVWFGIASQRRVRSIEAAIERIVAGDFTGRLPVSSARAETDRIALGVNRMLDAIGTLYEEIRGVGDDMAHDLRTPLARVRTQLERSRDTAGSVGEFRAAIDRAITGLDQALAVMGAILRIGEIEHRSRRSGFAHVELDALVRDVADLYAPLAEDANVALAADAREALAVDGDRELLFEALANLVDNGIKFAAAGGHVAVRARSEDGCAVLVVEDDGIGIPESERANVLGRFVRGDKSRHVIGNGLGLSLVAAVARLHGCVLRIGDAGPGCVVTICFGAGTKARIT